MSPIIIWRADEACELYPDTNAFDFMFDTQHVLF